LKNQLSPCCGALGFETWFWFRKTIVFNSKTKKEAASAFRSLGTIGALAAFLFTSSPWKPPQMPLR
jgi:hypothetical protein